MVPRPSVAEVESYRRHLGEYWGIEPVSSQEEVLKRLSQKDQNELRRWRRRLLKTNRASVHRQFYSWMAQKSRFGLIHSLKWMEILTSGTWAAIVLRDVAPEGPVLDLGCNAGYWTSWASAFRSDPVIGIDWAEPVVRFGLKRCRDAHLPGEFLVGDFTALPLTERFSCAVSLQGLTLLFHEGDLDGLSKIGVIIKENGYLLLVDELPGPDDPYSRAIERAGFSMYGAGMVGGLGIDGEWKEYTGLILRKDGAQGATLTMAKAAVEEIWQEHSAFASKDPGDWTKQNSAYFLAAGGPVYRTL